jgi:NitT/TauT family transport system permease protein
VRRPSRVLDRVLFALLGGVIVIGMWWLAVVVFDIQPYTLPAPPAVLQALAEHPQELLQQVWPTLVETVEGFGLATGVGLAIALTLTGSTRLREMFYPVIVAVNAVPKLALAPLTMAWFGLGQTSRVALVFLVCFFPVVVAAITGLSSTPAELAELARSLSASRAQTFRKVRLPSALPQIFVGLKVGVTLAVIGAVISEFTGNLQGLGFLVSSYSGQGRTPEAFAAIILLSLLSMALYYLVVACERLIVPWARATVG